MAADTIELLMDKGVSILAPQSIQVDNDIEPSRISGNKVTIHSGCKLFGQKTLVCDGVELGLEGPVTLKNCFVGPHVKLKGGYFENAVFLEGAQIGSGAHVRGGTIFEEFSSAAHTVGLKQTILFPYVTLGSLINFCDCLMAGGTGPLNHSEVGSSYIHFNFTPDQNKATASLIGDVPKGVMLNQAPIFLGGQGGLVGPCTIAYGTVVAAGSICRKDQLKEDHLVIEGGLPKARMPLTTNNYRNIRRILTKNLTYIGNLIALHQWYRLVRTQFVGSSFPQPLMDGLFLTVKNGIRERIKQLDRLKDKVQAAGPGGSDLSSKFCRDWPGIALSIQDLQAYEGESESKDAFLREVEKAIQKIGKDYLKVVKSLDSPMANTGSSWLQSIIDHVTAGMYSDLSIRV